MKRKFLILAAAVLVLAGCAGMRPALGTYAVGKGMTVQFDRTWTDVGPVVSGVPELKMFTYDGGLLNRILTLDGLPPGRAMVAQVSASQRRTTDKQVPMVRAGMSELELVEFVADSLSQLEYQRITTEDVTPHSFSGRDGVSFAITAATTDGLNISGKAIATQVADRVYLLIFLAPSEHYFGAFRDEVGRIFESARLTG
jgi:hypothetical protein